MRAIPRFLRRDDGDRLDAIEPFKVRADQLSRARRLRLCDGCMSRRCCDSLISRSGHGWKNHRATQWWLPARKGQFVSRYQRRR